MSTPTALILFAHGARDSRWAEPLERLAQVLRERSPGMVVELAFLELMAPALGETLDKLVAGQHCVVRVLPVFWSAGGHVVRDLPLLLEQARVRHPGLEIQVLPVLSDLPGVLETIAEAALGQAGNQAGLHSDQ